jgi:hypothetical protein
MLDPWDRPPELPWFDTQRLIGQRGPYRVYYHPRGPWEIATREPLCWMYVEDHEGCDIDRCDFPPGRAPCPKRSAR